MSEILRRKLRPAGGDPAESDPCDQAWQLALIRALREGAGLVCEPLALGHALRDLAELPEILPERGLIALLDGPGEALGMIVLSFDLMAALIERQTTGRIGAQPALPRRATRTDAAMVAELLDRALAGFDELLAERGHRAAPGFRYASFLEDARALGLLLEDQPWRVCRLGLSMAEGARQGEVLLALPGHLTALQPPAAPPPPGADEAAQMLAALSGAECRMQAVLGRVKLPLSEVMALHPGQILDLTAASLSRIRLETPGGRLVARARLGQSRGARALRLTSLDPEGETEDAEEALPYSGQGASLADSAPLFATAAQIMPGPMLPPATLPDPPGRLPGEAADDAADMFGSGGDFTARAGADWPGAGA